LLLNGLCIDRPGAFVGYSQGLRSLALTKYTQNEGLSSYFITKIAKDSYGFLWVGTQEGLNLFDGVNFETFSKQSPAHRRIGGSFVADLLEDKKRNLMWVLTSYGDVCALDLTTRTVARRIVRDRDGTPLSEKWIRCLQLQGDTLWMAGLNVLSAYLIPTGQFAPVNLFEKSRLSTGEFNVNRMTFDRYSRLWVFGDGYGVAVFDARFNLVHAFNAELASRPAENRKLRFWDYQMDGRNLFVASSWGLLRFEAGSTVKLVKPPGGLPPTQSEVLSVSLTTKDHLLFSTPGGVYDYEYRTQKLIAYQDENKDDDWLSYTYQLFYDRTVRKVWVGTQSGLASFSLQNSAFQAYTKSSAGPTRLKHLYSILPVSDREVYCGDENGVFVADTHTKEINRIDGANANLLLFKDVAANVFLSNKNGFYQITGKKTIPAHVAFPELAPLHKDQLHCGVQYNDSLVIFSSVIQKGLSVWNTAGKTLTVYHHDSLRNPVKGLAIINYLFKGSDRDLFILTEKSIIRFDPVSACYTSHSITDGRKVYSNFMDMCETDQDYWVATYGDGVIQMSKDFKVKKVIATKERLSNSCVYRVFREGDQILCTTNKGVSVIDSRTYQVKNYFRQDGLHDNAFEQACGYQLGKKIYTGGVNGFTIIEPALFTRNLSPPHLYWKNFYT
jgi:ligand-binding sensor domain-containing protein